MFCVKINVFKHVLYEIYGPDNVDLNQETITQNINENSNQLTYHLKDNDKRETIPLIIERSLYSVFIARNTLLFSGPEKTYLFCENKIKLPSRIIGSYNARLGEIHCYLLI